MTKVMIVDDDKDVCETVKTLLEKKGYTVKVARSSTEFLKKVKSEKPELLILDIKLPKTTNNRKETLRIQAKESH